MLVTRDKQQDLIDGFKKAYAEFYPEGSALKSQSYGHVVSPIHHKRLREVYARTKGRTVLGGTIEEPLAFEPTVVADVKGDDSDFVHVVDIAGVQQWDHLAHQAFRRLS